MRMLAAAAVLAISVAAAGASPAVLEAQADVAYHAKQFARCADLYSAIAAASKQRDAVADAQYSAACCYALDGKRDAAFAALDRAVTHDFHDVDNARADSDLASLHADPRWPRLLDAIRARIAVYEKSLGAPALRREILAMIAVDQTARRALIGHEHDVDVRNKIAAIDRKNTARMKEIVAQKGWPTRSMVGSDGASAAWLLVQHADLDRAFQKACLAKMEPLVEAGEVDAKNWAYLVDRVAVAEHRKQRFGTQFNDQREPQPIEDEAHVDERRASVGLGTLADYKQQMLRMYGPPAKPVSAAGAPNHP